MFLNVVTGSVQFRTPSPSCFSPITECIRLSPAAPASVSASLFLCLLSVHTKAAGWDSDANAIGEQVNVRSPALLHASDLRSDVMGDLHEFGCEEDEAEVGDLADDWDDGPCDVDMQEAQQRRPSPVNKFLRRESTGNHFRASRSFPAASLDTGLFKKHSIASQYRLLR